MRGKWEEPEDTGDQSQCWVLLGGERAIVCVGAQAELVRRKDLPDCELRKGLLREGRDGRRT